ncbi:16S rRNA (cytosine(1402)-N(4))-methyltransferase RsmH [Georgenia sp. SUBG003]|uniref:16S rRNA (cytosine(1402)-N(4))-methyltransferase RsmH n=1 Tax=Georgenia sp. SUBG003 TaxID=1497974 RepID=UPI000ACEF319
MSQADADALHVPVLLERCLDLLAPAVGGAGAVLIDATLGMGGHTEAALRRFPDLRVVGIDRDPQALELATARLAPFAGRFVPVRATYDHIDDVAAEHGRDGRVQGVLMDLGVSSLQLDEPTRGFSYAHDAPLDMRMDQSAGISAAELLATADEAELRRILRVYGEEKFAGRIAAAIVRRRQTAPLERTGELVEIVRENIPQAARRRGGNPAKRTFQALRIAVNGELEVLERALPRAVEALAVGGRIVVESYHSLEDRAVKTVLAAGARSSAPADLPVEPETHRPYLELLTRGAEEADDEERARNPRAASVRLRAAQRVPSHPPTTCSHPLTGATGGMPHERCNRRRDQSDRATPVVAATPGGGAESRPGAQRRPVPPAVRRHPRRRLLGVLLLNTQMAATSYEIHDKQVALNQLDETEASLRAQVEQAGSPTALEGRAKELGMVPAEGTRFVLLADGSILGAEEQG